MNGFMLSTSHCQQMLALWGVLAHSKGATGWKPKINDFMCICCWCILMSPGKGGWNLSAPKGWPKRGCEWLLYTVVWPWFLASINFDWNLFWDCILRLHSEIATSDHILKKVRLECSPTKMCAGQQISICNKLVSWVYYGHTKSAAKSVTDLAAWFITMSSFN